MQFDRSMLLCMIVQRKSQIRNRNNVISIRLEKKLKKNTQAMYNICMQSYNEHSP